MSEKEVIFTPNAPTPIGPYSQAIKANGVVYVSGCIGFDPTTMKLVEGGVGPQTRFAILKLLTQ